LTKTNNHTSYSNKNEELYFNKVEKTHTLDMYQENITKINKKSHESNSHA
jgi:hypothetical protein